jgi:hypothetical protein
VGEFLPDEFGKNNPANWPAICQLAQDAAGEPIMSLRIENPRRVEVTTGVLRDPRDGDGHVIVLVKRWWTWEVASISRWAA